MSNSQVDLSRPHFIGIGGIGMSGLAKVLATRGVQVSGSDVKEIPTIVALRYLGCDIQIGHDPKTVLGASCVVVSQAIRQDNIELVAARENGIPVVHRAEALAAMMDGYRTVVVAGTHGKSSTTTMMAVALQQLGKDPSFVVGADLNEPGSNAYHGSGEIFAVEADESDRSFHYFRPQTAVILNIEEDHHDHYGSLEDHLESYETFVQGIKAGGTLVINGDNHGTVELTRRLRVNLPHLRIVTYGESDGVDVRLLRVEPQGFSSQVTVRTKDGQEFTFTMNVPGRHMANNATAALAVAQLLEINLVQMGTGLGHYQGIRRRFTVKGTVNGVTVVDSYAHHPSEIAADLDTARAALAGSGRVLVAFQPHLPSRTQALGTEIGQSLANTDLVVIMQIFEGREDPIPGVTNQIVGAAAVQAGANVLMENHWMAVPGLLARHARSGDLVLTMGAGDVTQMGPTILEELTALSEAGATSPEPATV